MKSEKNVMSENKPENSEILNDDGNDEPKSNSRQINVYHLKGKKHCLAWKIRDISVFNSWKSQKTPLSSKDIFLPPAWKNPAIGSQVVCGTCGSSQLHPTQMIYKLGGKRIE